MSHVVVASWNIHSGVDGWGRPFDVLGGCRSIDADVLVLQETWTPDGGRALASEVADELGYRIESVPIAAATMFPPPAQPGRKWGPPLWKRSRHGPRVHDRRGNLEADEKDAHESGRLDSLGSKVLGAPTSMPGSRESPQSLHERARQTFSGPLSGAVGLAVLTRPDVVEVQRCELGRRFGDPTRRSAIAIEMTLSGLVAPTGATAPSDCIVVVGTHLSHLRHSSITQVARLRSILDSYPGRLAVVLAGDMNLPGPFMSALVPGFARAVRGRTWPAWKPIAQPDHVLVRSSMAWSGEVLAVRGSDHLPVRVRFAST